jgi:hypothetical protein
MKKVKPLPRQTMHFRRACGLEERLPADAAISADKTKEKVCGRFDAGGTEFRYDGACISECGCR